MSTGLNDAQKKKCYYASLPYLVTIFIDHWHLGQASMSLLIGKYEFEGPLVNWRGVKKEPGMLAILSFSNRGYEVVEIAESSNLQSALNDEDNLHYWQNKSIGMLTFSVHYSPRIKKRNKRREMVNEILREFDGDCREFQPQRGLVASGAL